MSGIGLQEDWVLFRILQEEVVLIRILQEEVVLVTVRILQEEGVLIRIFFSSSLFLSLSMDGSLLFSSPQLRDDGKGPIKLLKSVVLQSLD